MPLKYLADVPEPVTVVGWIHGVLFMAYVGLGGVAVMGGRGEHEVDDVELRVGVPAFRSLCGRRPKLPADGVNQQVRANP